MIAQLIGKLVTKKPTEVVLDVNGVGYHVFISLTTCDQIGKIGDTVRLHTHLHVREDIMQLFGFFSVKERELFNLLISVSGVGPRTALAILSGLTADELQQALLQEREAAFIRIKGIGKKTAQRLILELKDKAASLSSGEEPSITDRTGGAPPILEDAVEALIALGFKPIDARDTVQKIIQKAGKPVTVEEIIRHALKG